MTILNQEDFPVTPCPLKDAHGDHIVLLNLDHVFMDPTGAPRIYGRCPGNLKKPTVADWVITGIGGVITLCLLAAIIMLAVDSL